MKYFIQVILALGFAVGLAYLYALKVDPELQNYASAYGRKAALAVDVVEPKVVFLGGSSCAHSVRPSLFYERDIPCVNMGYHAGAGAPLLIAGGISVANPGDLVVMVIEPALLTKDDGVSRVGLVGAIKLGDSSLAVGGDLLQERVSLSDYFFVVRPGGGRLAKSLAIVASRFDAGKYLKMDEYGWFTNSRRVALPYNVSDEYTGITDKNRELLESAIRYCSNRGIQFICAVPWKLCRESDVSKAVEWDRRYIQEISAMMPVLLEDVGAAAVVDGALFSDSSYHLDATGATFRTESYLDALNEGRVISDGEIISLDLLSAWKQ